VSCGVLPHQRKPSPTSSRAGQFGARRPGPSRGGESPAGSGRWAAMSRLGRTSEGQTAEGREILRRGARAPAGAARGAASTWPGGRSCVASAWDLHPRPARTGDPGGTVSSAGIRPHRRRRAGRASERGRFGGRAPPRVMRSRPRLERQNDKPKASMTLPPRGLPGLLKESPRGIVVASLGELAPR